MSKKITFTDAVDSSEITLNTGNTEHVEISMTSFLGDEIEIYLTHTDAEEFAKLLLDYVKSRTF